MIVPTLVILTQAPGDWLLGPRDLLSTPTRTSPGAALRREVEDRYYATPFYERDALAQREAKRSTGLARLLWLGLSPRHRGEAPQKGSPQGKLPVNDDREVLRARLLADYRRLYPAEYRPLLAKLVANPDARQDYRMLRAASFDSRLLGGDLKQILPLAKAAEALRPDDATTWWMMGDTYYSMIAHGVGNGRENWSAYLRYADRCRAYALASQSPVGKEDARRLDHSRQWLGKFLKDQYNPDGTPMSRRPPRAEGTL